MEKQQLNLRISSVLARDLRVEAAQMGLRISEYIELLLTRRMDLLKGAK